MDGRIVMLKSFMAAVMPTQFPPELAQMIPDGAIASMVTDPARAALKKVHVAFAGHRGIPGGMTTPWGSRRLSSLDFGVDHGTIAPFGR
jgi:hypothetical protein